jgi:hypothetical protein
MRQSMICTLAASTVLMTAMVGTPTSAQSQTIIIINGNGSGQPYYPQAYPYAYPRVVYDDQDYYPAYGYQSYYNGYYPAYGYGYARPYRRYWGW